MKYLNYKGLLYYTTKIKEYIESKVFKRNFESTSSEAKSASGDGVTYFTSDTKQIIKDGVAYGGSLATTQVGTASDQVTIKTITEEAVAFYPKTHVDAVEGILKHDFNSQFANVKNLNNDIVYFTTDSKQIIRNGVSYGGSIATTQSGTASDLVVIKTVTEENVTFYPKTHVDAVEGILKHDFNQLSADVENQNDDVVYFTADSKQIIRNGISYGGSIIAEDVDVIPDAGATLQAVTFVKNCVSDTNSLFTIKPNYKYVFGQRDALTISLAPVTDSTIVNHYMFEFSSGSTATTLSLPTSIKWTTTPSIKPNKTYLISIENNLGVIQEWA